MDKFNVHEWNYKRRLAENTSLAEEKQMVLQNIVDYAVENYLNMDTILTSEMLDGIINYCQKLKVSDY